MSTVGARLPGFIHQYAERLTRRDGVSLNQLIGNVVGDKLAALETEQYHEERAGRGKSGDIDAILTKVAVAEPDPKGRL